jgi:predicted nucleic acid-binding protein
VILLDTSGLLAAIDSSQKEHAACASALRESRGPRLLSPFVLAELDYLLGARVGAKAQTALLEEVARGAYQLEPFGAPDVAAAAKVIGRYAKLRIGLADASIVVLSERHQARDVLTLDRRHFRVVRRANGRPFRLLPP